jgi:Tol biopolymer transport system component
MRAILFCCLFASACCPPEPAAKKVTTAPPPPAGPDTKNLAEPGETHFKHLRQITFGGDNAEAYWSFDNSKLIFQTNHKPYACDQIEEMAVDPSLPAPTTHTLVSTGKGRTTCSYYLKGDQDIIYASTQAAGDACPTPPDMSKGYYWGLFEYDIYRAHADGTDLHKLTDTPGYDAEGTVCPVDGSIIFTSQRSGDLELWRMNADGTGLRQLTDLLGYDGGAFFSPDCSKIVWRASRPVGKDLEEYKELYAKHLVKPTKMDLWVANSDGTDARQLTYLPGASFGPSFYPDGKRIIFASNYLSPRGPEFDLYGIDLDGSHLEKLTTEPSFDGFPMFSPDGKTLSFSSNRRDTVKNGSDDVYRVTGGSAGPHDTNVFLADWQDQPRAELQPESAPVDRYAANVAWLADDAREGRGIGTQGLRDAADYVQKAFAAAGAEAGAGSGGWRQSFEMVTEIKRKDTTAVTIDGTAVDAKELAPMAYSSNKDVTGDVVAAGWGIVDKDAGIDDYKGVSSVKGKIVLVHRFVPAAAKLDAAHTRDLGDIRRKSFTAKQKGAIGMIVVDDGDTAQDEAQLPELRPGGVANGGAGAGNDAGIPIVVVTRKGAAALFDKKKKTHKAKLVVALEPVPVMTDNVIGVIHAGAANKLPGVVVLGAHLDHLGMGGPDALDPGVHAVHNGADDNASGVAALIEATIELGAKKNELQRDVYVMAFSGEEEGLLGSEWFLKHPSFQDKIVAMINMDMVGRMRNNQLHINGADSAPEWKGIAQAACDAARVVCSIGGSGYGPSDQMSFYVAGSPVLFLFTGSHTDYHTATDDADKINSAGGVRAGMVAASAALAVANRAGELTYVKAPPEPMGGGDGPRRASLGTVPSYDEDPNRPPGMVLSDVVPDGPAMKAGMQKGDRLIKLDDTEIRSVNDLMFVLQTSKPGTSVKVTFVRQGQTMTVTATYGAPRQRH